MNQQSEGRTEYSDGPWTAEPHIGERRGDEKFVIRNANEIIAVVYGYVDHPGNAANARLIAAAPKLLAALQDILGRNEIQSWFNVDKAKAAVAAKTGETA